MDLQNYHDIASDDPSELYDDDSSAAVIDCDVGKGVDNTRGHRKESGKHLFRVSEYARILALKCGLDLTEANLIKEASRFHDIGESGVSGSILNKPGKLDPEEWEIMKSHAELGYQMLRDSKNPVTEAGSIIALTHHERWDGSGYPQGLSGSAIPLYGRIAALADVFDSLTSDRPYKKAVSLEESCSYIYSERGKHFDPHLVTQFLESMETFFCIQRDFAG